MPLRKRGQVTFSAEMFPYYSTSLSISSLFALIVGLFIILGHDEASGQGTTQLERGCAVPIRDCASFLISPPRLTPGGIVVTPVGGDSLPCREQGVLQ